MPLTLVTGPANAGKAGAVLGPLRDRAGEDPLLVVPSFEDVEHAQRELAERGVVFGVGVVRFDRLFATIASRAGHPGRPASELQRLLVAEDAVRRSRLSVLARSAERPGFARAAARFAAELERATVEPQRLTRALRDWAGDGPRRGYAEEVAEVYRRYREGLDAAGLEGKELFAWRSLDALGRRPEAWGATPVFAYGFDDFTKLELDALELLAGRAGADVTVSFPYEPGREAFRALAGTYERLREVADETVALDALDDHYAPSSRSALHALERRLYEAPGKPARSGGVVRLHVAGGQRAELELCTAEVLRMIREGTPPGEVAVVLRDPQRYASLVEQIFRAYGIPYSIDRSVPFAHTGIGRGLLALLRCAALDGTADDLLAYLRTPGFLREPALADLLEADVRRAGVSDATGARGIWEATPWGWDLDEVDRLARAAGAAERLVVLHERLERLFAAPHARAARVLDAEELGEARAFSAAHDAIAELHDVVSADRRVELDARKLHDTLAGLRVRTGENPQPDRVQVASPLGVRARRFAAVLVCGLAEGEFPARSAPEAFLPDADRRELARVSGLRLPLRESQLDRERYLFYVCASRAERELVLSCRSSDEEGNPEQRSFFLADAGAVLGDLEEHVRKRSLADVTWSPADAPTDAEWERAVAREGPRRRPRPVSGLTAEAALAELASKEVVSASALENFAGCPVKWLVENVLSPEKLEPDPEQMVRGAYAHRVLELTLNRLRDETGSAQVTPATLDRAERILIAALREERGAFRVSPNQTRVRAAVRRLEFDLLRYLGHEAGRDGLFRPEHLELRFGIGEDSPYPVLELDDGTKVRGVIDRVDTWNPGPGKGRGWGLVRDYKSGRVDGYKASDWERENRFQGALYMLAVERLLGLRPAGAVYTPLSGTKRVSRGLVAEEVREELGSDFQSNDVKPESEFAERMAWAQGAVAEAARRMRAGELCSTPDGCAYRGGCSHPSICRVEG